MSEIFIGAGDKSTHPPSQDSLTSEELSRLESMPKEELTALIKRICGARWGEVGMMSDDEAYEAVCLKMLHGGLTQPDIYKALPALKEWTDRRKGKPAQSVALTVEDKGLSKMATSRLLALERELARVTGEDELLVLPAYEPSVSESNAD